MPLIEVLTPDYTEIQHVVAGAAVEKGEFVALSETDGFYFADAAIGDLAAVVTYCKKTDVPKLAGQAWTAGQAVYWDPGAGSVTTVAAALSLIGYVEEAGASADTRGIIVWNGNSRFLKA